MTENNNNDDFVNKVTLEYFINSRTKATFQKEKIPNKKDVKFYRKRILGMTKNLLEPSSLPEKPSTDTNFVQPSSDVIYAFNLYSKTCIEYFKTLDITDIIQDSYLEMLDPKKDSDQFSDILENQDEANKYMMRSIKMEAQPTMDKFVKRIPTKPSKPPPPLPKQKNINLKDPILKTKGLSKTQKPLEEKENV
jgi:hypothetical protein